MLAAEVIDRAERRIGQTLSGKWHLDRVIGVGGMAAVYEATHRNRNRVAIKLLHPELSLDDGTRARFLREGYVANTIRHSGAVQVLDDDVTEEGLAFLVMELLQGESLEERMLRKGGVLEAHEALEFVSQLLDVLEVAHEQGVVHRDIKPDNLFLTSEGQLKVLDFGIARLHQGDSRATKAGSFMGTPAFCAPEQARGRWDEVDARTDLFSVGATLFTMLAGVHVHEAETSSEQLALAISATARSLRDVCPNAPRALVELVDTALAYDKDERFQDARSMRAAVERVRSTLPPSEGVSTPPPDGRTLGHVSGRWTKPRYSRGARVVIGVVLAAALAGLLLWIGRASSVKTEADVAEKTSPTQAPREPDSKSTPAALEAVPVQTIEEKPHVEPDEAPFAPSKKETTPAARPASTTTARSTRSSDPGAAPSPSPRSEPPGPASPQQDAGIFDNRY